jgi:hypothetical protein
MSVMTALREYRQQLSAGRGSGGAERATWHWNMEVSFEWGSDEAYVVSGTFRSTNGDSWPELASLNALLAEPGDVVLVRSEAHVDDALLSCWRDLGIMAPGLGWLSAGSALPGGLLISFGNGVGEERLAARHGLGLFGGGAESFALVNSKARVKRWCHELGIATPEGRVCHTLDEVIDTTRELLARFERVAIKEAYGASGRGILLASSVQRVQRLFSRQGRSPVIPEGCVVEGWYPARVSHNTQWLVLPSGQVSPLGSSEQLLADQKYKGNFMPSPERAREPAELYVQQRRVARHAFEAGYRGVLGIDSVLTEQGELFPVIELNGRFNLSTYALAVLEKLGHPGPACLRSYTVPRSQTLALQDLFQRGGRSELPLYRPGRGGVLPLGFTGKNTPLSKGLVRFIPLLLADGDEHVFALGARCDEVMARVGAGSLGGDR